MSRTNLAQPIFTHEGATAKKINPLLQLKRSVLSCLLWEDTFYESGKSVVDRIKELVPQCPPHFVAQLAIHARKDCNLRHVPLLLVREMARHASHRPFVSDTLAEVICRADELSEFLALYWKDGRCKLANQVKAGLAKAFTKFNAYQLAKYNGDNNAVKLRDVLFLCHAKPKDEQQAAVWKQLIDGTLASPDTWEVELSAVGNNKDTWTRLITEGKLGYFALIRNLRNMAAAGVDRELINRTIIARERGAEQLFPYRFVAAARIVPQFEPALDKALLIGLEGSKPFDGLTVVLVDVSRSMERQLSAKSDLTRLDAAATLASLIPGDRRVFSFSRELVECPPRLGMAGVDSIRKSQDHNCTYLGKAVKWVNENLSDAARVIVVTDEQSDDPVPDPVCKNAYLINVASYQNGVGYGPWTHIDGFSETVLNYIRHSEADADELED